VHIGESSDNEVCGQVFDTDGYNVIMRHCIVGQDKRKMEEEDREVTILDDGLGEKELQRDLMVEDGQKDMIDDGLGVETEVQRELQERKKVSTFLFAKTVHLVAYILLRISLHSLLHLPGSQFPTSRSFTSLLLARTLLSTKIDRSSLLFPFMACRLVRRIKILV
jgi:hypothetical protein